MTHRKKENAFIDGIDITADIVKAIEAGYKIYKDKENNSIIAIIPDGTKLINIIGDFYDDVADEVSDWSWL